MRSTRSCRRPLYSSVVPRTLMTEPGAGQGGVAVPDLGVDLAGAVGQIHIQIFCAVAAGALIRRTNQQKAFELLILAKLGNG